MFQMLYYTLKMLGDTEKVVSLKSKGSLTEQITTCTATDNSFSPSINWYGDLSSCLSFKGSCLKQKNTKLDKWSRDLNSNFPLKDCLFEGVKLSKNADPDKYIYNGGYSIGFDSRSEFSLPESTGGKNFIVFRFDVSLSLHIDNKKKDILILGIRPTQGLDDTTLTTESQYSISYSRSNKEILFKPALSWEQQLFLSMLQKHINSKQKILK